MVEQYIIMKIFIWPVAGRIFKWPQRTSLVFFVSLYRGFARKHSWPGYYLAAPLALYIVIWILSGLQIIN